MKGLYIIIGLIIIGGVAYFAMTPSADAPVEETDSTVEEGTDAMTDDAVMEEGDAMMEEEGASTEEGASEHTFEVKGTNFAFDVTEIRVKEGDTVTINFVSEEGFHDWVVDEFDAATEQVEAGGTTSVTFVASAAGEYEYYCSVGSHREQGMVGTLIVE